MLISFCPSALSFCPLRDHTPHGRWWVIIQAAKVAVPIHQLDPHGKVLGQAHQGVVHGGVAMGVELAQHLAHHACALPEQRGQAQGREGGVRVGDCITSLLLLVCRAQQQGCSSTIIRHTTSICAHGQHPAHPTGVRDKAGGLGCIACTDHAGWRAAAPERLVVLQAQLVHGVQDAAVHRLEAVAHIWQRTAHNHGHCILQQGWRKGRQFWSVRACRGGKGDGEESERAGLTGGCTD